MRQNVGGEMLLNNLNRFDKVERVDGHISYVSHLQVLKGGSSGGLRTTTSSWRTVSSQEQSASAQINVLMSDQ